MLKLTTPKSFLRFAKNMTVGELKNVTDQDLLQYKSELESTIKLDYEEDFGTVAEHNQTMVNLSIKVYGQESKQHKYLYRNFAKGGSVVDVHYSVFPSSTELESWVRNSKSDFYEDFCVPANNYQKKEDN